MENSYSNTYIKDQGGKVVVCCMYNKELITESQKVNIILSYTYNNIHFSPNKYVIARTCRKHTMTVFDLGTVKKFPIFHPFPISAMTKENLSLSFFPFVKLSFPYIQNTVENIEIHV